MRVLRDALRQRGHEVRAASTDAKLEGRPPFADVIIPRRPRAGLTGLAARSLHEAAYRALKEIVDGCRPNVVHLHIISEFGAGTHIRQRLLHAR
jgi:hypothetical protein